MSDSLQALSRHLRRRTARDFKKLKRQVAATKGRPLRLVIEPMDMDSALTDQTWAKHAWELFFYAFSSAMGDRTKQCFVCCQPWAVDRSPVVFVSVTMIEVEAVLASGVCADCADADMTKKLIAAAHRDFGAQMDSVQVMPLAGHA